MLKSINTTWSINWEISKKYIIHMIKKQQQETRVDIWHVLCTYNYANIILPKSMTWVSFSDIFIHMFVCNHTQGSWHLRSCYGGPTLRNSTIWTKRFEEPKMTKGMYRQNWSWIPFLFVYMYFVAWLPRAHVLYFVIVYSATFCLFSNIKQKPIDISCRL